VQQLGPTLAVHDAQGYLTWDRVAPTGSVLFRPPSQSSLLTDSVVKGRTVIGLYFSADWCTPCRVFNSLLKNLYSCKHAHCTDTNRNIPPFEVVLVSRCRDARATEHYFSAMPWAAMLHADATGARGLALRDRFAITTIPALVLLDGDGAVLCCNAHEWLRDDPLGKYFPWAGTPAASRPPRVDFDIVAHSRPDAASLGTPLRRPPGEPVPFGTVRPDSGPGPEDRGSSRQRRQTHDKGQGNTPLVGSQVGAADGSRVGLQAVQEPGPQPAPRVGPTPAPTAFTSKRKTMASKDVPRPRPPPKPGARPSPSIASRAVHALAATAAASHNMTFVPRHLAAARSDFSQGKPTLLMRPQPLSVVHPFTPTLNKWRHGIRWTVVRIGPGMW
jgi:nucleoredoxin